MFYESVNPSPVIVVLVLPVNGPNFGSIEKIAYGGPVIVDTFKLQISFNQSFFHPPWTISIDLSVS